jgi:hypothetical protein
MCASVSVRETNDCGSVERVEVLAFFAAAASFTPSVARFPSSL